MSGKIFKLYIFSGDQISHGEKEETIFTLNYCNFTAGKETFKGKRYILDWEYLPQLDGGFSRAVLEGVAAEGGVI